MEKNEFHIGRGHIDHEKVGARILPNSSPSLQVRGRHVLRAEQRPGQAGWAAAAVDADFAAGKGADIESAVAEAVVGLAIFCDGKQTLFS